MSYKYSDVREYHGNLLLENRKNQNYVEINSDGIKYTRNNETPASPYFALELDGNKSSVNFHYTAFGTQFDAGMSAFGVFFKTSGAYEQKVGIHPLNGVYYIDTKNKKENQMTPDGLHLVDHATNKTCELKFEDGVLKINGKEIATIENS